jgi:thioredoxin
LQKLEDWQTIVGGSSETLLIDFYADWCGPCKKLTPRLEKRVNESGGKIKLLKINIDKFGQIAQAFQIKGVPTVYMVHGGKAIDAFTG